MKSLLFIACVWSHIALAKTVVMEAALPLSWPAMTVVVAIPEVVNPSWSAADAAPKVRQFLAAEHSAQEKIDVLAWWAGKVERPDFLVDLAWRCAVLGQNDNAFYWLQRAAREDTCDPADIEADENFAKLLKDPRWPKVKEFLDACEAQWQASSFYRQVLTLPESYDGKSPIPLVIGLHGYGSLPEDFSGDDHQRICDAQGLAFLSVSGRRPLGRNSFMWTESFDKDWRHIEAAIERARQHLNPATGKMAAIGFSQGGQLAAEICAAQPQHFRGCLSMSPGSRYASGIGERLEKSPASLSGQQYFFSWISGEGVGPKQRVQAWRPMLEKQQAQVYQHEFPGKGHTFPRNYEDYFSIGLQVILR